jgi:ribonuclease HI
MPQPYYVVHRGRRPGIYRNWNDCKVQVEKFDGAVFKKFDNEFEANKFLEKGFGTGPPPLSKSKKIQNAIEAKNQKHLDEALTDEGLPQLYIYTDGSLIRNGTSLYSGYGYYIPSKKIRVSRPLENQKITNNRAELTAIIESIGRLSREELETHRICIFTDSQYSIYLFTGTGERYEKQGWKNDKGEDVPNPDLIQQLLQIKRTKPNIYLLKVRAHTGAEDEHSKGNHIADQLANDAAMKMKHGGKEINPFRQIMFGEEYQADDFQRLQEEKMESKVMKIVKPKKVEESMEELFENYQTKPEEIKETKRDSKRVVEKKLKTTNLKSWFLDD